MAGIGHRQTKINADNMKKGFGYEQIMPIVLETHSPETHKINYIYYLHKHEVYYR